MNQDTAGKVGKVVLPLLDLVGAVVSAYAIGTLLGYSMFFYSFPVVGSMGVVILDYFGNLSVSEMKGFRENPAIHPLLNYMEQL